MEHKKTVRNADGSSEVTVTRSKGSRDLFSTTIMSTLCDIHILKSTEHLQVIIIPLSIFLKFSKHKKTVRNADGSSEVTVTRSKGDQSHTVVIKKI
jgi:hypothetical protein